MEFNEFFKDFQDHLAPRLDTYEQAIYLYIFRHTRLCELEEAVFGFKSARSRIACGIGEKGKPMSESTASEKLQSLQNKGCILISDSTRGGRKIRLFLPSEISGVVAEDRPESQPDIDLLDYFGDKENRARILAREEHRCFYCLRDINSDNYVIEHVTSRPAGDNSYRNVVAACRQCNNRKKSIPAEEWLRTLYREGYLDASNFEDGITRLHKLRSGNLKPPS